MIVLEIEMQSHLKLGLVFRIFIGWLICRMNFSGASKTISSSIDLMPFTKDSLHFPTNKSEIEKLYIITGRCTKDKCAGWLISYTTRNSGGILAGGYETTHSLSSLISFKGAIQYSLVLQEDLGCHPKEETFRANS